MARRRFPRLRKAVRWGIDRAYTRLLSEELKEAPRPRHVGILVDGNRRWARSVGHDDLSEGYKAGGAKVVDFLTGAPTPGSSTSLCSCSPTTTCIGRRASWIR